MVGVLRPLRRIEEVEPTLVATLAAQGSLPQVPPAVEAERGVADQPAPTLEQIAAVTWLGAYERDRMVGILGYRKRFDVHRLREQQEVIHVAGSARAVRDLLAAVPPPLIGEVALTNLRMIRALHKLGLRSTRVVFEGAAS